MKKSKTKKPATLGSFKILKEKKKQFVVWDIEMDEGMRKNLIKIGKEAAEKNPDIYINIGMLDVLERQMENENKQI